MLAMQSDSSAAAYKRIVLKLSGEALRETGGRDTISPQIVREIASQIKEVHELGVHGMALQSQLEQIGVATRVQTAIEMKNVAEPFIFRRAIRHLELGRVVIFVAGTGNPYFSTDTTAALRASEIGADIILKATKVDGIYDRDPNMHTGARRYERVTFTEALTKRLQIMDSTAFSLCMDNKIPIVVFDMNKPGNIRDAVLGKNVGTIVSE